jgi:hypothetical protein
MTGCSQSQGEECLPVLNNSFTVETCAAAGTSTKLVAGGACDEADLRCVDPGCTRWTVFAQRAGDCNLTLSIDEDEYHRSVALARTRECPSQFTPANGSETITIGPPCDR